MSYTFLVASFSLALFFGMLLLLEAGRRFGVYRTRRDPEGAKASVGAMDSAVFALMGLLVAFTFSGAATRFDTRRELIVEEANNIGTAYLRIDLLPPDAQSALRETFRRYVDSRLAVYQKLPDLEAARDELTENARVQKEIWNRSIEACLRQNSPAVTSLVIDALNAMIDITTTRTMTALTHPPKIVFLMLFGVALASAVLGGYTMGTSSTHRSLLHMLAFAAVTALTVYVILEIEFPRLGLIQVRDFDKALIDVRASMND